MILNETMNLCVVLHGAIKRDLIYDITSPHSTIDMHKFTYQTTYYCDSSTYRHSYSYITSVIILCHVMIETLSAVLNTSHLNNLCCHNVPTGV